MSSDTEPRSLDQRPGYLYSPVRIVDSSALRGRTNRLAVRVPRGATTAVVAGAVGAASLAVTVPRALTYPFWQDEVGAARIIEAPGLLDAVRAVVSSENHPPAYYAVGWGLHAAGAPIEAVRAVSVLATASLAIGVVLYARRILPVAAAGVAGLIIAIGWQFERHGWELRPYALFALAALVGVYALERATECPTLERCALLSSVVAVGSLVHYFFVFTLAAGVVWMFASPVPGGRRRTLVAIAVGLVPLAIWIPAFVRQFGKERFGTLPGFSVRGVVNVYAELLERSLPRGVVGLVLALAILALVLVGVARLWRDPGRGRLCALATVVPVGLAAVVWLAGPHVFAARALIGVAPFTAIAIGAAVALAPGRAALATAAVAALLLVVGFARADARITPDYDHVANALVAEGWEPKDPIVLFGALYEYLHPLDWYLPGSEPLRVVELTSTRCDRLFIVAVGGQARALTAPLGERARRVDAVVIGSLPWRDTLRADVEDRGGSVLGTLRSPCVRRAQQP